jgi:SAM-dependent methyltransferase
LSERDRELFDRIALKYCRKDVLPAHRRAREHRLLQTFAATGMASAGDVLEIGCGAGFAATYLRGRYTSFLGIDHSAELIDCAREINGTDRVSYEVADANEIATDRRFDLILMIGVLHHLPDPAATLGSLTAFLGPNGVIAVNEPLRGNPLIRAARALRKKTDTAYSADQREFSADEIRAVFSNAGCEIVSLTPQGVLSTPLAEVVLPGQWFLEPLSAVACALDTAIERKAGRLLSSAAWNVIAVGRI